MSERIYTTEQLSERLSRTPEGYLLCADVPINRTGEMIYNEREAKLMPWLRQFEPDEQGRFRVIREPEEVFRPETLKSFEGKPFIILHPDDGSLLRPDNWAELAQGNMQNIRRGEGDLADCTLADVLATTENAIELILAGMREVSCGYDADYIQLEPGILRQINIVGNHLALVDKGRAGARCAIQDSEGGSVMSFRTRLKSLLARKGLAASALATVDALSAEEEDELQKEKKGTKDEEPEYVTRKDLEETLDCWWKKTKDAEAKATKDAADEEEKKKKDEEEKKKGEEGAEAEKHSVDWSPGCATKDAALQDLAARSEILIPGFTVPQVADRPGLTAAKRAVLKAAYATEDGKKAIERFTGANISLDAAPGATLDAAFIGASELIGQANNGRFARRRIAQENFKPAGDIAAINKANRDFWDKRTAKV